MPAGWWAWSCQNHLRAQSAPTRGRRSNIDVLIAQSTIGDILWPSHALRMRRVDPAWGQLVEGVGQLVDGMSRVLPAFGVRASLCRGFRPIPVARRSHEAGESRSARWLRAPLARYLAAHCPAEADRHVVLAREACQFRAAGYPYDRDAARCPHPAAARLLAHAFFDVHRRRYGGADGGDGPPNIHSVYAIWAAPFAPDSPALRPLLEDAWRRIRPARPARPAPPAWCRLLGCLATSLLNRPLEYQR